jgi:hypothetical protein
MKQNFRISLILLSCIQVACSAWGQGDYADCDQAKLLCNKAPMVIPELGGFGNLQEFWSAPCFGKDFQETNSIWLRWKTAEAGTLSFTILPLNAEDDIDFALYWNKGLDHCNFFEPIRCMAAGPNLGGEGDLHQECTGATGLRAGSIGGSKSNGCTKYAENFLSPVDMKAGEYYTLFINNFRSSGGVLIEWGGTATFQAIPGQCTESSDLSQTTSLQNGDNIQFSEVFPNPTTDRINIRAFSSGVCDGQLQVLGTDGQLELSSPFALLAGNNLIEVSTEHLSAGAHFIRLQTNTESYLLRFIKQ